MNNDKISKRLIVAQYAILVCIIASIAAILYFVVALIIQVTTGEDITSITTQPSPQYYSVGNAGIDPATVDYTQYFVSTNTEYTERFQGDLAQMAINLNYFDFDSLIADLYPGAEVSCTPVEAMDGSTTYDFSFQAGNWQVELATLMDNETCMVISWIDIYNLEDSSVVYEHQSLPARLKPSNYLTGMRRDGSPTKLFTMERGAFADFIVLVRSGGLNQDFAIPFDLAKLEYQAIPTAPDPASN